MLECMPEKSVRFLLNINFTQQTELHWYLKIYIIIIIITISIRIRYIIFP
jgi:hypothetical protein